MNKKPKLKTRRPSPSKSQYNVLRKKVSANKVAMTATVTMTAPVSVSTESVAVDSGNDNESEALPRSPSSSSLVSSMSQLSPSVETPANGPVKVQKAVRRKYSRTHNKTFHRRFLQVDCDEELINYFSCALLSDILLQGYLYISDNYFGFYSNIFGYKTKLLIPISEVAAVTREKTVKIIPNAVGIVTSEGKYVFGSLISRESTYRVMYDVWSKSIPLRSSPEKPKLRVSKSVDTVSELPIKLTAIEAESILCKISESQTEKLLPKIVLPEDTIAGYSSKTNSLKRRTLSPRHKKYRRNNGICTDTESDINSGDELLLKHAKFGSKFVARSRSKNVREYLSLFLKIFSQRANSKSLLLSAIIVTLILLVISAVFMLYKVNIIHHYLSYFAPHKIPSKTFYSQEMQRINDELKSKLIELSHLMESLHNLLVSIDNITQSCLASNKAVGKPFSISTQCGVH